MVDVTFKNKLLKDLIEKDNGHIMNLKTKHVDYPKSVEAGKIIIEWGQDRDNGFIIEFNKDYSKIRKRKINN